MHADPNLSDTRYLTAAVMGRLFGAPDAPAPPPERCDGDGNGDGEDAQG